MIACQLRNFYGAVYCYVAAAIEGSYFVYIYVYSRIVVGYILLPIKYIFIFALSRDCCDSTIVPSWLNIEQVTFSCTGLYDIYIYIKY